MMIRDRSTWFSVLVTLLVMALPSPGSAESDKEKCTKACTQHTTEKCCVERCVYYSCANEVRKKNVGLSDDIMRGLAERECNKEPDKKLSAMNTCHTTRAGELETGRAAAVKKFQGIWLFRGIKGQDASIELEGEVPPYQFVAITEKGVKGIAQPIDANTIVVDFPFAKGLKGILTPDGNRINWSNGEFWTRASP